MIAKMTNITIRNLDNALNAKLRVRAAQSGRSMEEEIRVILKAVLEEEDTPQSLGEIIHNRFVTLGGFDLSPIVRGEICDRPLFDDL